MRGGRLTVGGGQRSPGTQRGAGEARLEQPSPAAGTQQVLASFSTQFLGLASRGCGPGWGKVEGLPFLILVACIEVVLGWRGPLGVNLVEWGG